ncbi:MAG: hypothetical protein Crog4KO_00720 [Crocinitomicaceae bacterium]
MKTILILVGIGFLCSCNRSELEALKKENEYLKGILDRANWKLDTYDNAFVIPHDSISKYFVSIAVGETSVEIGDTCNFASGIGLYKFPKGYKWEDSLILGAATREDNNSTFANYSAILTTQTTIFTENTN